MYILYGHKIMPLQRQTQPHDSITLGQPMGEDAVVRLAWA